MRASIFLLFWINWMLKKPRGSPFCILANFEFLAKDCFKFLIFSEFIFFKYISTNNFFNTIRIFRYTRITLRFTKAEKNEPKVRKQANLFVPAQNLWVFRHFYVIFLKKSPEHVLTSRERPKFAPYLRLKSSKSTSKC